MTDLITIDELIAQTNSSKIHIAYLTKLGILPNAVKRKIDGKLVGCYPKDSLTKILEVKSMKDTGITYSQLAKSPVQVLQPIHHDPAVTIQVKPSNFAYLVLGLVIGVLVSTLNTSGLATMKETESLPLESDIYLIGVDKHNLDKLDKTNINYLIKN